MTTLPSPPTDEIQRAFALAQRELWINIARQAMKMVKMIEQTYGLVPPKKK